MVSRLTEQKGLDLLLAELPRTVGPRRPAGAARHAATPGSRRPSVARPRQYPGRIGCVFGYDEPLSHLIQGGGDAILMPSRFEPCGLTQLYGLRYGSVPIVARVGGLADTVIDANDAALNAGVATGFQFTPVDAAPLAGAIRRATTLMRDRAAWAAIQKAGMKSDVSWDRSAARYADLYASLMPG